MRRSVPLKQNPDRPLKRTPMKRSKGFTAASKEQRAKVKAAHWALRQHTEGGVHLCYPNDAVDGLEPIDPMHLTPRSKGGCDHPDCVVAAGRVSVHRPYDAGTLDLLAFFADPYNRELYLPELQHMLTHLSPVEMVEQLANARVEWRGFVPEEAA